MANTTKGIGFDPKTAPMVEHRSTNAMTPQVPPATRRNESGVHVAAWKKDDLQEIPKNNLPLGKS